MHIDDLAADNFRSDYKELVEKFLFNNYPLVRKAISDELYMFLMCKGGAILDEEASAEISELLSNVDILEENEMYLLFKQRWEDAMGSNN